MLASTIFLSLPFVLAVTGATFSVGQKFQIVLNGVVDASQSLTPDADVFDIDMYDTPSTTIAAMKAQGKTVICYFSAGTYEQWRPDAAQWSSENIGTALPDWPGENWANIKSDGVRAIMLERVRLAAAKGCDAIDPDNVDVYTQNSGFSISQQDAVDYFTWLSGIAAANGLSIGLKNSLDLVKPLASVTQFALNESCARNKECDYYKDFLAAGKPVFNIEYPESVTQLSLASSVRYCSNTGVKGLSTVLKRKNLKGYAAYCDLSSGETKTVAS